MTDTYRLIAQSQAAYARVIDTDHLEEWPGFFADPCSYVITTADNHREGLEGGIVFCNSHGMLRDRISALRDANIYERHHYRHILGSPFVLDEEPHATAGSPQGSRRVQVKSETPFLVTRIMRTGDTSVFATGRYLDTYVIRDGQALIENRIVVCDSSRIDTLLVIPL